MRISEPAACSAARSRSCSTPTKQDAKCDKCTDERKDKPIVGMTIMRNVKQSADDDEAWDGGDILDPNNGKVYKVRLKPLDGGKRARGARLHRRRSAAPRPGSASSDRREAPGEQA